jgi:hypothetical protein
MRENGFGRGYRPVGNVGAADHVVIFRIFDYRKYQTERFRLDEIDQTIHRGTAGDDVASSSHNAIVSGVGPEYDALLEPVHNRVETDAHCGKDNKDCEYTSHIHREIAL